MKTTSFTVCSLTYLVAIALAYAWGKHDANTKWRHLRLITNNVPNSVIILTNVELRDGPKTNKAVSVAEYADDIRSMTNGLLGERVNALAIRTFDAGVDAGYGAKSREDVNLAKAKYRGLLQTITQPPMLPVTNDATIWGWKLAATGSVWATEFPYQLGIRPDGVVVWRYRTNQ